MNKTASFNSFKGPLRIHSSNKRYFTDDSGRAVYLTGSHTWASLQDLLLDGTEILDYEAFLGFMQEYKHNFMRMWIWEHAAWAAWTDERLQIDPLPFARTGDGLALDGKPKFDLNQWNGLFFDRLRQRVIKAGERGIYVSIMLFQGFSIQKTWGDGNPWPGHPFHASNNVNHVDGDANGDGRADIHTLDVPAVTAYQEALAKKVIDTVNDLDNVLYEIINEVSYNASVNIETFNWQNHMIDVIHRYEVAKPKQHPVGLTAIGNTEKNGRLFISLAEWISPGPGEREEYKYNPPAADGSKVILTDTDHLWGFGGHYQWVWKSFTRGLNPIFMDPWLPLPGQVEENNVPDHPNWELLRRNMGYTLMFAERVNLAGMVPWNGLASSSYCLANRGNEYIVYLPEGGEVEVDLHGVDGKLKVEWFNPVTGETVKGSGTHGGTYKSFSSPFAEDAVLYLLKG